LCIFVADWIPFPSRLRRSAGNDSVGLMDQLENRSKIAPGDFFMPSTLKGRGAWRFDFIATRYRMSDVSLAERLTVVPSPKFFRNAKKFSTLPQGEGQGILWIREGVEDALEE
jgi:hypothetical protein